MHGQFVRKTPETVNKEKSWRWLGQGDLKVSTEALLCAAQEQVIRIKHVKFHKDKCALVAQLVVGGCKFDSGQTISVDGIWQ